MFMLKLLTVIFFLYTMVKMFTHNKILRNIMADSYTGIRTTILEKNKIGERINNEDIIIHFSISMIFYLLALLFYTVEITYIFFSVKYDPYNSVILGYMAFWVLMLAVSMCHANKDKDLRELSVEESILFLDKQISDVKQVKLWSKIQYFIDFMFYVYMVYIFFIH